MTACGPASGGLDNHVYLHYTDWAAFCAHLQCLNLRLLLEREKFVFLIGDGGFPVPHRLPGAAHHVQPHGLLPTFEAGMTAWASDSVFEFESEFIETPV